MSVTLAEFNEIEGVGEDATTGEILPALPGGYAWKKWVEPAGLSDADKAFAILHGWYLTLGAVDGSGAAFSRRRGVMMSYLVEAAKSPDALFLAQAFVMYMSRMLHGHVMEDAGLNPAWGEVSYPIVSVGGTSDRMELQVVWEGDPSNDPRKLTTTQTVENPDWVPGSEDPEEAQRYISINTSFALPAGSTVIPAAPSKLQFHGGGVVYRVELPENFTASDTFTLHCFGGFAGSGSIWNQKVPADSELEIKARVIYYRAHVRELWKQPRGFYPLFVKAATYELTGGDLNPGGFAVVVAKRIYMGSMTRHRATAVMVDAEDNETVLDVSGRMLVRHTVGGYETIIEYDGLTLEGVETVRVTVWEESTDADAWFVGPNRCANSTEDRSGSWGLEGESGCKHYCAARQSASLAGSFKAGDDITGGCYQTGCSGWNPAMTGEDMIALAWQILTGVPWMQEQKLTGVPSFEMTRIGTDSLGSMRGMRKDVATGYHPTRDFTKGTERWGKLAIVDGLVTFTRGFWNELGGTPDLLDDETWPAAGPATFEKDVEWPGANDVHAVYQRQKLASDGGQRPYYLNQGFSNNIGKYQRAIAHTLFFHNLPGPGVTAREYYGQGDYEAGSWTFDGETYDRRLLPISYRMGRNEAERHNFSHSASVFKAWYSGGDLYLILRNGIETASSLVSAQEERQTAWAGRRNVVYPEWTGLRNWASSSQTGVERGLVHPGMTARFVGESFANLPRCAVGQTEAFYRGINSEEQSPLPETFIEKRHKPVLGLVRINYPLGATLAGVTVVRDLATYHDYGVTLGEVEGAPGADLPKDFFQVEAVDSVDVGASQNYSLIRFSRLNDTEIGLDRNLQIEWIWTGGGGGTDDYADFDLRFDAQGFFTTTQIEVSVPDATGVDSVTVIFNGADTALTVVAHELDAGDWHAEHPVNEARWWEKSAGVFGVVLSPRWAGGDVRIGFDVPTDGAMDPEAFISTYMDLHGASFPHNYYEYFRYGDLVRLKDAAHLQEAFPSASTFEGELMQFDDHAVFMGTPELLWRDAVAEFDHRVFEAAGEIYWKATDDMIGNSLIVKGDFASRQGAVMAAEINGIMGLVAQLLEDGHQGDNTAVGIGVLPDQFAVDSTMDWALGGEVVGDETPVTVFNATYGYGSGGDGNFAGSTILFPELTAAGATLILQGQPIRHHCFDRRMYEAARLGQAWVNLSITNLAYTKKVTEGGAFEDGGGDDWPGGETDEEAGIYWFHGAHAIQTISNGAWWPYSKLTVTEPADVSVSLVIFGVDVDEEAESGYKFTALGGGTTGISFTLPNGGSGVAAVNISQCLLMLAEHGHKFMGYVYAVMPAGAIVGLNGDSAEDAATALFSAYAFGSFEWQNKGVTVMDLPPLVVKVGSLETHEITWDEMTIGVPYIKLDGEIDLDGGRVNGHPVSQEPLEE